MPKKPVVALAFGIVLSGSDLLLWTFGWIRSLDWLKNKTPVLWSVLVSPLTSLLIGIAGLSMGSYGLLEVWRYKHPGTNAVLSETANTPDSTQPAPAARADLSGDHNTSTVVSQVHAINSTLHFSSTAPRGEQPVNPTSSAFQQVVDGPTVTCKGPFNRSFHVQQIAMIRRRRVRVGNFRLDGQSFSFRNGGRPAHGITVTLEYRSDAGQSVVIDRGYWEDASMYHDLAKGSTRHLIIAAPYGGDCGVLEADRSGQEIGRLETLAKGRWKLEVGFISNELNMTYYSIGEVTDNGSSTWTEPTTTPPSGWISGEGLQPQ